MKKRYVVLIICIVVALGFAIFSEEVSYSEKVVSFKDNDTSLEGNILLPNKGEGPYPCLIFVNGSQSINRSSFGYFNPYWQELGKQGYSSFSWDKPGVDNSTGDWRKQSMEDRAKEVLAAIEYLKTRDDIDTTRIGVIGFSQAGWVLPIAAEMSEDIKYIITISGAVDWISQGNFNAKQLMIDENIKEEEIVEVLEFRKSRSDFLVEKKPYEQYLKLVEDEAPEAYGEPLSEGDWEFFTLNVEANVEIPLSKVECPVLAIFGGQDAYVDVNESIDVYEKVLEKSGNTNYVIKLFENADHSMLKSKKKKIVHSGLSMYLNMMKWEILGAKAFPDEFFETIIKFIDETNVN